MSLSERERREYLQRKLRRAKEARDGLIREVEMLEKQVKELEQFEAEVKRCRQIVEQAMSDQE